MDQTIKYWPCKPELVCSNIDVFQSAAEQHYVKCARLFFQQVWGIACDVVYCLALLHVQGTCYHGCSLMQVWDSHIDFQVEPVNGGYKARVMMGQYVWCSCIHSSKSVAVNAAAKASVELAMQKASRQHKGRASAQLEMSHSVRMSSHYSGSSLVCFQHICLVSCAVHSCFSRANSEHR
jgi:hypothetical protein